MAGDRVHRGVLDPCAPSAAARPRARGSPGRRPGTCRRRLRRRPSGLREVRVEFGQHSGASIVFTVIVELRLLAGELLRAVVLRELRPSKVHGLGAGRRAASRRPRSRRACALRRASIWKSLRRAARRTRRRRACRRSRSSARSPVGGRTATLRVPASCAACAGSRWCLSSVGIADHVQAKRSTFTPRRHRFEHDVGVHLERRDEAERRGAGRPRPALDAGAGPRRAACARRRHR